MNRLRWNRKSLFLLSFGRNHDIMAKNQEVMEMDMDELGFFLFMEEQERKEKEQQQEEKDDGTITQG